MMGGVGGNIYYMRFLKIFVKSLKIKKMLVVEFYD